MITDQEWMRIDLFGVVSVDAGRVWFHELLFCGSFVHQK